MTDPTHSTVYLAMRRGENVLSTGTGVLYGRDGRYFIATAWHNFSGRNSDSFAPLSKNCAVPDNVAVTVALVGSFGAGWVRMAVALPLQDDDDATYLIHPDPWPRKDVAVLSIDPDAEYPMVGTLSNGTRLHQMTTLRQAVAGGVSMDIQPIEACSGTYANMPSRPMDQLRPGDDLFVLGYPRGIVDHSGAPIWKRATVASDPQAGWYRQPCFLIDCASRAGMSGAPVVLYSRSGNVRQGGMVHIGSGPSSVLCGIYVGRLRDPGPEGPMYDSAKPPSRLDPNDELFQAQLGRVWKTEVIDEIIDAGKRAPHPDFMMATPSTVDRALADAWPTERSDDVSNLRLAVVRYNVVNSAMVTLEANIEISEVYNAYDTRVSTLEAQASQLPGG